jgi:hypothetical protein
MPESRTRTAVSMSWWGSSQRTIACARTRARNQKTGEDGTVKTGPRNPPVPQPCSTFLQRSELDAHQRHPPPATLLPAAPAR